MILTTKGRYAVMAIVDLAQNSHNKPSKMSEIAKRQEISQNYLEQIFSHLKNANIVQSTKGPGGGYMLNDTANEITISDIIKAVSEPIKFTRCGNDNSCTNKTGQCTTHPLWKGLENQVQNYLTNITVADVCRGTINY